MKFLMFVCNDPNAEPYKPELDNIGAWVEETQKRKLRLDGNRLRPAADAITVKKRQEKIQVVKGPFADKSDWIAGFDLLECASQEEAIEIAGKHPMARFGSIELRALWPFEG